MTTESLKLQWRGIKWRCRRVKVQWKMVNGDKDALKCDRGVFKGDG